MTTRQPRVVLADNNADTREYVTNLLCGAGFDVQSHPDGAAALEAVHEQAPDLVLTDVMMPRLGGFELLAALRADRKTATVPVIMLSAQGGEEARVESFAAGADDYLVRPFSERELVARVRAYVELSRLRRAAETELHRLQSLISQVPAAVNFLRGKDMVFDFAHPMTLRSLGGREVQGKPLLEALPELQDQPFPEQLQQVFKTGKPFEAREKLARLDVDGTGILRDTYWNYVYLPVRNADGDIEGVMTFDVEVTEQVMARKALKEADFRKDEFLAMLAHELRNPLAAMSTALAVMERTKPSEEKAAKLRVICQRQIVNLVRLVDDLLDVSRITRGKVELRNEPVDLATVVQNAVQTVRSVIEARNHELSVTVASGTFRFEADPTRLEQVVSNLLTNAAKYTDAGGQIQLRLTRENDNGRPLAVLRVRDTGRGIPEEMLSKVFEPFVQVNTTLDRTGGGLGIGLTLVKRLVEMHGGSVTAQSGGSGTGTEMTVRLPLAVLPLENVAARPKVLQAQGARRILLVEDNEDARETLKELLEDLGHQVETAMDGRSGLRILLEMQPDVALVDVGLPGIDGYELARRVRAAPNGEGLYLVALTGYGGPEARTRAEDAGFDRHVVKPVKIVELSQLVSSPRQMNWKRSPGNAGFRSR